jgi:hypothetical protein
MLTHFIIGYLKLTSVENVHLQTHWVLDNDM